MFGFPSIDLNFLTKVRKTSLRGKVGSHVTEISFHLLSTECFWFSYFVFQTNIDKI